MAYTVLMQPAVFLDLDQTIIENRDDPSDAEQVTLIKGAAPAIASLRGLGYRIIVAANHDAVARGRCTIEDVQALHQRVAQLLKATANGAVVDAFYFCPYHPKGDLDAYTQDHPNRKPKPGMLTQAAGEMSLELASSWMIGDELADVQAGHAAGTRTILLRPDADRLNPVDPATIEGITSEPSDTERPAGPDFYAVNLIDAARLIAQQPRIEPAEHKQRSEQRKRDSEKIARLQVPRPASAPQSGDKAPGDKISGDKASGDQKRGDKGQPIRTATRSFRPWDAPGEDDDADKPIVAKPYRRRHPPASEQPVEQTGRARGSTPAQAAPSGQADTKPEPPPKQDTPTNIREAIRKKEAGGQPGPDDGEQNKLLRMILQELRSQRGLTQEFSYLTIVAVALQLVAFICLLGGLFMGSGDDGLYLRWLGAALITQLMAIATLMLGR